MISFDSCTISRPCTDCIIISCKLGTWSIKGAYSKSTYLKAEKKYRQAKALGTYKNLQEEKANGIKTAGIRIRKSNNNAK